MRTLTLLIAACLLSGCSTTIKWHDPKNPQVPVFSYTSDKDIVAEGFLVIITYHEDGTPAEIHVEIGSASGRSSPVVDAYGAIIEAAVSAAVEAAKP